VDPRTGAPYYANRASGEVRWTLPTEGALAPGMPRGGDSVQVFDLLDTDGDGVISRGEFDAGSGPHSMGGARSGGGAGLGGGPSWGGPQQPAPAWSQPSSAGSVWGAVQPAPAMAWDGRDRSPEPEEKDPSASVWNVEGVEEANMQAKQRLKQSRWASSISFGGDSQPSEQQQAASPARGYRPGSYMDRKMRRSQVF